jgi:transcription elongation GreA/GreB family factor
MNAEVAAARVLTPADVPTDHVGVGSRVLFRRPDNRETYEMTFLGPWEADHSRGWFNYRAPLAQTILGKRIGDNIDFDHGEVNGRYEIAELHNALNEQAAAGRKSDESSMADASTQAEYAPDSA